MNHFDTVSTKTRKLRVAIVHYWFVGRAGGERVVEALADMFPQADLFALVADREHLAPSLTSHKLHTSFLQHVPGARKFHRHFLFLHPLALEHFDLTDYDLVISSESGPAKGVVTSSSTCHICYCHSPMRYIWDMFPRYRRNMNLLVGSVFSITAHYMRLWDLASASRVDFFVANSQFIASRIRKFYGRESVVIHPPVDVTSGRLSDQPQDYYLAVGRLVDYKRFDLVIQACSELGRPLKVIGVGPELKALRRLAGPTVEFCGGVSDEVLHATLAKCRALLFAGEEDFGIVPVEAQSFGRPVIAYASGGALETVKGIYPDKVPPDCPTGIFFEEQSAASLQDAIYRFESIESIFVAEDIRTHSLQYSLERFKEEMSTFVAFAIEEFRCKRAPHGAAPRKDS